MVRLDDTTAPSDANGQRLSPSWEYVRLYRRVLLSQEFAEPPEHFAARIGIDSARSLLVGHPANPPQGGAGPSHEVFDHESRSLLHVSPDMARAERATDVLRRALPFEGHIWAKDADFLAHVHAWKIATPADHVVGFIFFPHLDIPSTDSYASSRLERFLLTDYLSRLVFSNPACRHNDGTRRLDRNNLFLPSGLFWLRGRPGDPDPSGVYKSGVFVDVDGRPFATAKALEDPSTVTRGRQTRLDLTSQGSLLGPLFLHIFTCSRRAYRKKTGTKVPSDSVASS